MKGQDMKGHDRTGHDRTGQMTGHMRRHDRTLLEVIQKNETQIVAQVISYGLNNSRNAPKKDETKAKKDFEVFLRIQVNIFNTNLLSLGCERARALVMGGRQT